MLAAVYRGRNDLRIEAWPEPPAPPPGWVTVEVAYCGICGTDLDEVLNGPVLTGPFTPVVLGHEPSGRVVEAGPAVDLPLGTRVGLENSVGCNACARCLSGNPQLCAEFKAIGLMLDGALAQRVNVPASMCAIVPDNVSDELAAMAEPLSVAVRAVRRAGQVDGGPVIVVGAGTIGLLVAQVARAAGASPVVLTDPNATRLGLARRMGFDAVTPPDLDMTAGVVFECSGTGPGLRTATTATARGGVTVLVGLHAEPRLMDLTEMLMQERSLVTSLSHSLADDYRPAFDLLAEGRLELEPLITDKVPLARAIDDGFDLLVREPEDHLKILIDCRD